MVIVISQFMEIFKETFNMKNLRVNKTQFMFQRTEFSIMFKWGFFKKGLKVSL